MRRGHHGTTLLTVGALALALLAAPGCGSGGSDSSTSPQTKAAFVKQAEAACAARKAEEIKAFSAYTVKSQQQNLSGQAQARFVVDGALQPIEALARELRELGGPDGDEAQVAEIVDAFESVVEEGHQDPAKTLSSESPYRRADKLAAAYGLKGCSEF